MTSIRANLLPLIVTLPLAFAKFWFIDGPQNILQVTWLLTRASANVLSIPILLRTFFKPWKGEYRKGYVGIAVGVGVTVRLFMLLAGILITVIILAGGIIFCAVWLGAPFLWILLYLKSLGVVNV